MFRTHVPEVAEGSVEILRVARAVGRRSCIAVRARATHVDPVEACAGSRGSRLKAMAGELNGEHLTVVRWDESPSSLIQNAFGCYPPVEVVLDEPTRTAFVTVVNPNPHAPDLELIGELANWTVRIHGERSK